MLPIPWLYDSFNDKDISKFSNVHQNLLSKLDLACFSQNSLSLWIFLGKTEFKKKKWWYDIKKSYFAWKTKVGS